MRKLMIIFILAFTSLLLATDVSGIQTGVWDLAGSPYVVVGDVEIPLDDELTIEPGVFVEFNGAYQILASGILNAQGTEENYITFDRHSTYSGNWDEIRLEHEEAPGYEMSYCFIRGAETAVNSIDAPLHIHNCHLTDNTKGIHLFAIGNPDPPDVLIEDCWIEDSVENGIDIYENGNAVIQNCELNNNGLGAQYRGAIQVNIQSDGCECSPQIIDNYIHDNNKQGITCTDMFSAGTINALIENNVISSNLTGVYFYNCGGSLVNNEITDNFIAGDMNSGAGVMCYGSLATPDIKRNMITGNYTALYIVNNANPCMGDLFSIDPLQEGWNTFQNNIDANGNNNSVYVFNCSDTYTIMAENNTWDSEDPAEIGLTIYDGNDSPGLPEVDFEPVCSAPQLLSGIFNYIGGYPVEDWEVHLINVNNTLEEIVYDVEYGSFEITDAPAGYYFLVIRGMTDVGGVVTGTYGDWRFPAVLTVNESSQYTFIEIEVHDYLARMYLHVPRVQEEGDTIYYHLVEGDMYPRSQAMLYKEGDYLYYQGIPQYGEDGWYCEELNPPHPLYLKFNNLEAGDSWQAIRYWDNYFPATLEYTVTAKDSVLLNEQMQEMVIMDVNAVGYLEMVESYVYNCGLTSQLHLSQLDLLQTNYHYDWASMITPPSEPSILPLELNYSSIMLIEELPEAPWNLRFAWGEDDDDILIWSPPASYTNCETYRIYANNTMIAELSVSDRTYPLPDNLTEDTTFYVTGYDGSIETYASNLITWIVPVENDAEQISPTLTRLDQNYPNPFSIRTNRGSGTKISFYLKNTSQIQLAVYNIKGQKIKELISGVMEKGDHQCLWNGETSRGTSAAAGIYFYRLKTPREIITRKLLLIE